MRIDDFQPVDIQWCDICRPHQSGHCDGCRRKFDRGERAYRSQSHHFHPTAITGISGSMGIHKELCVDCYRQDHANVYPNQPVPSLPDRMIEAAPNAGLTLVGVGDAARATGAGAGVGVENEGK